MLLQRNVNTTIFESIKVPPWTKPKGTCEDLHDTFGDQPISHLTVRPPGVGSVLGVVIVILHKFQKLLPGGRLGVDDTMLNEPFMDSASGPSFVEGVGNLQVSDTNIVKKSGTSSRLGSGNNVMLFKPSSELVVVPRRENVVLGVVKGFLNRGRSMNSLAGSSIIVSVSSGGNGRGRLGGGMAIDSSGGGGKTAFETFKELCLQSYRLDMTYCCLALTRSSSLPEDGDTTPCSSSHSLNWLSVQVLSNFSLTPS